MKRSRKEEEEEEEKVVVVVVEEEEEEEEEEEKVGGKGREGVGGCRKMRGRKRSLRKNLVRLVHHRFNRII